MSSDVPNSAASLLTPAVLLQRHVSFFLNPFSLDPVPKPGMALTPHTLPHPRMAADHHSGVKHLPGVSRGSPVYPQTQIPEMCYDNRIPPSASQYEPPQFSAGTTGLCSDCTGLLCKRTVT